MISNNYTSIKRLKRRHIQLINTIQKMDSTATSNGLQPVSHNGKILVTKKSHAFNGKFDATTKRKLRTRRKFSLLHFITVLSNIKRGSRKHQGVDIVHRLA